MHWRGSLPSHYPGNGRHRLLGLNEPLNLRGMPISRYPQMRCIRSKASAIQPVLFSLVRRRRGGLNLLFSARETSLSLFLCGFTYLSRVYTLLGRKPCNSGIQPNVQHGQQHYRLQLHSIGRSFHPPTPLTMYIRLDTCSPV